MTEKVVGNKITYTLVGKETLAGTYNGNLVVKSSITSVNTVTVPVVLTVASAVEISSCTLTKYEDATYGGFCNILQGEATQYVPDTDTLKAKSGLLLSGFTRKQADVQNYVEGLGYKYIKINSPVNQSGDLSSMFTIPPLYSYVNKYNVAGASAFRFNVPNGNYQVRFISSTTETSDSYQDGDILLNGTSIKSQLPSTPYGQTNEWTKWFDVTVTDNVITLLISVEKSKRIGLNVIEIKIMN